MSDITVAAALRSDSPLVVVEAPAGCGKTHQAADYAHWVATTHERGQVLILTHTHAACDVFRNRTLLVQRRVHITTIDGLITQISGMYHAALGLPADTASWARSQKNGFEDLARKVVELLTTSRTVSSFLAVRYPVVLCDEHQDANADQHAIAMILLESGAKVRIFGDTMQAIYVSGKARKAHDIRWAELRKRANLVEVLDYPHRWDKGSPELGKWVLRARQTLKRGLPVDLSEDKPAGLSIIVADNIAPASGGFRLELDDGRRVRRTINAANTSTMILSGHNVTVRGVNAFLGRSVPIWEGHTRDALQALVDVCTTKKGNSVAVAEGMVTFIQNVAKGFSDSAFANRFMQEVKWGCCTPCKGKPAHLQAIARCIW